ncbi:MAG: hypothetical protein ACI8X5_002819 [Planctomycetota bacterium]|jgi:hypothetical protein
MAPISNSKALWISTAVNPFGEDCNLASASAASISHMGNGMGEACAWCSHFTTLRE